MAEQPNNTELAEGYPTLIWVLQRMIAESEAPDARVERVEINLFASGDATYRYWPVRAEESLGGYLEPE
jgi:hypothetical protein